MAAGRSSSSDKGQTPGRSSYAGLHDNAEDFLMEPLSSVHVLGEFKQQQRATLVEMQHLQRQQLGKLEDVVVRGIQGVADGKLTRAAQEHRESVESKLSSFSYDLQGVREFATVVQVDLQFLQRHEAKLDESLQAIMERQNRLIADMQTEMRQVHTQIDSVTEMHNRFEAVINERFALLEQLQLQHYRELTVLIQRKGGIFPEQAGNVTSKTVHSTRLKTPLVSTTLGKSSKRKIPKAYKPTSSSESTSSEHKSDSSESDTEDRSVRSTRSIKMKHAKLPAFTGKESWTVWFTRFKEIARRQGWSREEKLDELLPKLQGAAGEFVYDQLSSTVRQDYRALTQELENRFRKVINPKTYGTKFSACNQRPSQSAEDYAAELKMLYDKAYPSRDRKTRDEDLLRRFLSGLHDRETKFQVEYVKNPKNIDAAVDEVVNFQEVRRMQGKTVKSIKRAPVSDESDDPEEEYIQRVWKPPVKPSKAPENSSPPEVKPTTPESPPKWVDTLKEELKTMIKEEVKDAGKTKQNQNNANGNKSPNKPQNKNQNFQKPWQYRQKYQNLPNPWQAPSPNMMQNVQNPSTQWPQNNRNPLPNLPQNQQMTTTPNNVSMNSPAQFNQIPQYQPAPFVPEAVQLQTQGNSQGPSQ